MSYNLLEPFDLTFELSFVKIHSSVSCAVLIITISTKAKIFFPIERVPSISQLQCTATEICKPNRCKLGFNQ